MSGCLDDEADLGFELSYLFMVQVWMWLANSYYAFLMHAVGVVVVQRAQRGRQYHAELEDSEAVLGQVGRR